MQKSLIPKRMLTFSLASVLAGFSSHAAASAFQLFEENGAGTGDYHAGGAAEANDASTEFYNPAGLVRIKNQQMVVGGVLIPTDIQYKGSVEVNTVNPGAPTQVVAQGGTLNVIPNFHYAAPLTDRLVFGFGITVPFGLETDYGDDTFLRYAGTETQLQTINISPTLGFAITDKLSVGAGFDAQYLEGQFDQYAGLFSGFDTTSTNKGSSWGYGYNLGVLYQFTPHTRVGLSYRSRILQDLTGKSTFSGPLANSLSGGTQVSYNLNGKIVLPPTSIASFYHDFNSRWAIMGSAMFTQWKSFDDLVLNNVASLNTTTGQADNQQSITVHEDFRNTWNYALGAQYTLSDKWLFRGGIGYDETPTNDTDRNIQLPDSNRFITAVGAHYQANKSVGVDVGWTHLFVKNAPINNTQTVGSEQVITVGNATSAANVFGIQLTWDIV